MTEIEFIQSIDCQFPYDTEAKWRPLIERGASISPNAAFMILHELCRLPSGVTLAPSTIEVMLDCWTRHFEHPLVAIVLPAAKAMIRGETITVERALSIMQAVAAHRDQYNALSIPYLACDDTNGRADALYQEIINAWKGSAHNIARRRRANSRRAPQR